MTVPQEVKLARHGGDLDDDGHDTTGGGSGAPSTADYLVGTANGSLSAEIVVGATPGGELGGTWGSPTVDATHSGSTHAATQAAAEATAATALSGHTGDATDAHDASAVSFVPAGSIAATNVQDAIEEVAAEAGSSGRWELAVITGSPPDPLYTDGDYLYIFVP